MLFEFVVVWAQLTHAMVMVMVLLLVAAVVSPWIPVNSASLPVTGGTNHHQEHQ